MDLASESEDSGYQGSREFTTAKGKVSQMKLASNSGDSGYLGSGESITTEGMVPQRNLASESGESTHTVVGPASAGATKRQGNIENLSWPPQATIDPVSRTEQWVEETTFDVFVKNMDGKTHTIQVEQFEKVSSFKQKVGEKLGVPREQQHLISQGKTLADDNLSLHDYKIKKHSTVYCQGRLRGGQ